MLGQSRSDSSCGWRCGQLNELTSLAWTEIRLGGTDALSFAAGQVSQEVRNERQKTLVLAPDGLVVVGGEIFISDPDISLVVPTALAEITITRLRRFLLRVDVSLTQFDGVTGPYNTVGECFDARWPSEYEWSLRLPPHSYGQWVVESAVSFTKGCFTGQELVGRADARGATMPWRFVGGRSDDLEFVDASLRSVGPEGPQGVSSWTSDGHGFRWRGVAHRTWTTESSGVHVEFMA